MISKLNGLLFVVVFVCMSAATAKGKTADPHLFGPTGIMGVISKNAVDVTDVEKGSPADGKIKKGDQLIGVGNQKFGKDLRKQFATAINLAEAQAGGGTLSVMLKGGKTVDLQLVVLGSFSDTAPYDCPKTNAIVTRAADYLAKEKKFAAMKTDLMGLLATGEKKYVDVVKAYIASNADAKDTWKAPDQKYLSDLIEGTATSSYVSWDWGYSLIFLSEYYLMTGDKTVLPSIERFAWVLARGQDAGGLYSHRLATKTRYGRLMGYAQMNQPSLTCFMGLLLAQKCGIKDQELTRAIETSNAYFADHIGKGSFKYGVHGAYSGGFNNNGTSGSAAICFSLKENKEGTSYFSQISSTSYKDLEVGHGGHFFNVMWTPLGSAMAGPEVLQGFEKRSRWLYTLYRAWDGRFTYDGGKFKHNSDTGALLLYYCVPRQKMYITGKDADKSLWLKGKAATDAVTISELDYKSMTTKELIDLAQNHPLPQVRRGAIGMLGTHRDELEDTWVTYLKEGTPNQKDLAISQFGWWHPIEKRLPQLDAIGAILRDESQPVSARAAAAGSITYMGEPALKFYPDIVKLIVLDKPDDPFESTNMELGRGLNVLSKTPFASGLVSDKDMHYKAALKLIRHKQQNGRTYGLNMLQEMPLEDFHIVADDILHVIEDKDPTYHSYHNPSGPIAAAIGILAHLNIREGLDYALQIGLNPSGKGSFRMMATWESLSKYRGNAKEALEKYMERRGGQTNFGKHQKRFDAMIKAVKEDKNPPKLISLQEAIAAGKK